jgi:hypothetical protein
MKYPVGASKKSALLFGKLNQICPALFVIRSKSLNRSKTINGASL